jgi:hypothetical protein
VWEYSSAETLTKDPQPIRRESEVSLLDGTAYRFVLLAYFPYFEKIKVGLSDHHAVCLYESPLPSSFE